MEQKESKTVATLSTVLYIGHHVLMGLSGNEIESPNSQDCLDSFANTVKKVIKEGVSNA